MEPKETNNTAGSGNVSDEQITFADRLIERCTDTLGNYECIDSLTHRLLPLSDGVTFHITFYDGASQPFLVFEPGGGIRAGDLLETVSNANTDTYRMIIIVKELEAAHWITHILRHPISDFTTDAVILHEGSQPMRSQSGNLLLVPSSHEKPQWELLPDGTLQLRSNNRTFAIGHIDSPPDTWRTNAAYATRWRTDNGSMQYIVIKEDSVTATSYTSYESLTEDWSVLHYPFLPTNVTYLDVVDIRCHTPDKAHPVHVALGWDDPDSTRHANALDWFLDTYTIADDDSIMFDIFTDRFTRVYKEYSNSDPPSPASIKSLLADRDEHPRRTDSNHQSSSSPFVIPNRRWVIPPALSNQADGGHLTTTGDL